MMSAQVPFPQRTEGFASGDDFSESESQADSEVESDSVSGSEWQKLADDSGQVFYYNAVSGESSWKPPDLMHENEKTNNGVWIIKLSREISGEINYWEAQ